jgi:hypothetical protein
MRTVVDTVLQDNSIAPAEWQQLNQRSRALGMAEGDVEDLARDYTGVGSAVARYVAVLATRSGPAFDTVRGAYTGSFAAGTDVLTPPLIPVLLRAALADNQLDFAELDGLRTLALRGQLPDYGDLRDALTAANVDAATVTALMKVVDISGMAWNSLASDPVALPIRLAPSPPATAGAPAGPLVAQGDLRVTLLRALTGDGAWSSLEFPAIRALLQPLGRTAAKQLLQAAGFNDSDVADQLAKQFTASDADYGQRMPQEIRFRRAGNNFALVTPMNPVVPAAAVTTAVALRHIDTPTDIGDLTFRSGLTAPADRQVVEIRGRQIPVVRPNREDDLLLRAGGIIMANDGLAPVPAHHLALIRQINVDPGTRQDAAADAGRDGVVTMYYGSATGGVEAVRVMVHEVGHLVSFQAASANAAFWTQWNQAARDDDAAVSLYGTTNQLEDFAESYLMYIVNRSAMATSFPHRAATIAPLVAPPAPPPPPARP